MSILTRHVLRAHLGPFLFAFTTVTGLIFLNAVAQRLETLLGRGLEPATFGEFMLLSLPHVVALTFPMSILVAVLYAFSELTGHNEVAAMAGGGIHPVRLMVPVILVGIALTFLMLIFNDRVLPEANHRLNSLMADVGSKSPTFELREEIVNEIHTGDQSQYFLRAREIDRTTNELTDVTIFDLTDPSTLRTIVAESGRMAFTPDMRDLHLTLSNGVVYGLSDDRPGTFQWLEYDTQILPFRGVGEELERRTGGTRGDREMPIAMLEEEIARAYGDMSRVAEDSRQASLSLVQRALGFDQFQRVDETAPGNGGVRGEGSPVRETDLSQALGADWEAGLRAAGLEPREDQEVHNVAQLHRTNLIRFEVHQGEAFGKEVEVHKKYAIAFACLIFVLLGPPLAMRYPGGGVGMVIAASVSIFFFYWMGLIGGERLAERGLMDPALAMWAPSAILLVPAIFLLSTTARQISTNRGSSWDELRYRLGRIFRIGRGGGEVADRTPREGTA
ncbi:MAG: LptF/LptG family permease [Gemmatimonadota bacterium]